MKKITYFILIVLSLLFVNDKVYAKTLIKDTTKIYDCNYSSSDGKSTATFTIYKYNAYSSANPTIRKQEVYIKKFKGSDIKNNEHDKSNGNGKAIIYNKCPQYMSIIKESGYKAATFWTKTNADNYISGEDGVVLTLTNDYLEQLESIAKYHDYQANRYDCRDNDIFCVNPIQEGFYDCDYAGDVSFNFSYSYNVMLSGIASADNLSTFISTKNPVGSCPAKVYSITKGNKTYLKFFGTDYPDICKNDSSVKCKLHTENAVSEYNYVAPVTEVSKTFTYYFGELKGTLSYNYMEYNYNDYLKLYVKGTSDGSIDSISLKMNNTDVYFVSADESKMKAKIEEFLKLNGGISMPTTIECYSNSDAFEEGNKLVTGIPGASAPSGYSGKLCEAYDFGGVFIPWNGKSYYLSDLVTDEDEFQTQKDVMNTLKNLDTQFADGWDLNCKDNLDSEGCEQFKYNSYKKAYNLQKLCKKYYADFTILEEVITECDTFQSNIVNWAKAGYFGNRIITETNDGSCRNILGALGVWLKKIYDIMKYAVPVIIVVFGIKDFISATISGKDDALKKASSTFVKRLIWGAVFVAIPVLVTMILTFAFGGGFADICIF